MTTPTVIRHTKTGSFDPSEHMEFVKNRGRIEAFKKAFEIHAPGKVVMDVGTGSGLLAIHALRAGARRVVAIEKDAQMAEIAHANFDRNGVSNKIELIVADALSLTTIPHVDILCSELLSTWGIVEQQVPVMKHLLTISTNQPLIIPKRVEDSIQGVYATFGDAEGLVQINRPYFEFSNTEPVVAVTDEITVHNSDFHRNMATDAVVCVRFRVIKPGVINALRLTSMAETVDKIFIPQSDDTNPAVIVPLPEKISVELGQEVICNISYACGGGWERFNVMAEAIGR